MTPALVWLNFIPVFQLGWFVYTVIKVQESVDAEFQTRGWFVDGDLGYNVGLTAGILWIAALFIGWIPFIGWVLPLAGVICWIIYWLKISDLKHRLEGPPAWGRPGAHPAAYPPGYPPPAPPYPAGYPQPQPPPPASVPAAATGAAVATEATAEERHAEEASGRADSRRCGRSRRRRDQARCAACGSNLTIRTTSSAVPVGSRCPSKAAVLLTRRGLARGAQGAQPR